MTTPARETQHLHEASYQHSIVSGFYQLDDGVPLDDTATFRASRPDLGAHYGRTRGTCRCGVEVMQLCVEGDTGFSNRRGWVPVADLEEAYAEHARRSLDAEPANEAWQPAELEPTAEPRHARDNGRSVRGRFNPPNYVNYAVCVCGWTAHGQTAFHQLAGHIRTGGLTLAERRARRAEEACR